jgi:choloylglycine hydrolase
MVILPNFSLDGMNERGVAIGLMAIPTARSLYDPSKITIGELRVIRLILDYAAIVQEAVRLID